VHEGIGQVIVSVGLVRARRNLFVDDVKYLLLLATPVEIVALAVTFSHDIINGEITLTPSKHATWLPSALA
jgi:nuclear pore complex protein Nup155